MAAYAMAVGGCLGAQEARVERTVEDETSASIVGSVFDASTRAPVDSFEVTIYTSGHPPRSAHFGDGRFVVRTAAPAVAVAVRASGYAPWTIGPWHPARRGEQPVEVALVRGWLAAGRVVDAVAGLPIAGATVKAVFDYNSVSGGVLGDSSVAVDAEGRFEIRLPEEDSTLRATAAGYASKAVRVRAGAPLPLDFDLEAAKTVSGDLVLADGTPTAGWVSLAATSPRPPRQEHWEVWEIRSGVHRAMVGSDGTFRFDDLAAGEYRLAADSKHGPALPRVIEVGAITPSQRVYLVVEPLATVTGTMSGLGHGEQATLYVRDADMPMDAMSRMAPIKREEVPGNGAFEIVGIPDGQFVLVARTSTGREVSTVFEIAEQSTVELDVAFFFSSRLRGRVLFNERGAGDVRVLAKSVDTAIMRTDRTAPDGTFAFNGMASGSYEIFVRGKRFPVDVNGDGEAVLSLTTYSLSGVLRESGHPSGSWPIIARAADGITVASASPFETAVPSERQGRYRFEDLPEGRYVVVVMNPFLDGGVREANVNADIVGFDFDLQWTDNLRRVQVVPERLAGDRDLWLTIRGGVFDRHTTAVPLDANGVGWIPGSLRGRDLRLMLKNYSGTTTAFDLPAWDGGTVVADFAHE